MAKKLTTFFVIAVCQFSQCRPYLFLENLTTFFVITVCKLMTFFKLSCHHFVLISLGCHRVTLLDGVTRGGPPHRPLVTPLS